MARQAKTNKASGPIPSDISVEELFKSRTDEEIFRDKLVGIARQQMSTSMQYKRQRMDEVQKSIDLYNGKTKKALKGRWNLPLPLISGYIDTLLSKQDDPPKVKFGYQDVADMTRAAKVQAKWEQDSSNVEGRWAEKDRQGKKIAGFYGYAVYKKFAFNDAAGMFKDALEVVDPLDFECEPMGGQNLRDHKFMGQRNIFRTEANLEALAMGENAVYDKKQVLKLKATLSSDDYKRMQKVYAEKTDRLKSLGFNPELHTYVGVKIYNLTEWCMEYDGIWYYMFFEPETGICIRFEELVEVFASGETPFEAWHTHPDPFNFYSKAPADDMRPVAEGMSIIFNQMLDARERKVYAQRAFDPAVFEDPSQLEWRPDGLVQTISGASSSQSIGAALHEFKIEGMEESGTINLMKFMDEVTGLKTGVTASAQGAEDDKRVGIYYGNLQQVADRLGLYNKAYSEFWGRIGRKYYFGLREHIKSNEMMVRMVGAAGYGWERLIKEDVYPTQDFNIEIVGGQAQAQLDEINKKNRMESLAVAVKLGKLNPEVATEEILRNGGWEEGQIKRLTNMQSAGQEELVSEAHQSIQAILEGKRPKLNRGAMPIFMQEIIDYAYDQEDLDDEKFQVLVSYADAHLEIATQNVMRKVRMMSATMDALPQPGNGMPAAVPGQAAPTAPGSPAQDTLVSEVPLTPQSAIDAGRSSETAAALSV